MPDEAHATHQEAREKLRIVEDMDQVQAVLYRALSKKL